MGACWWIFGTSRFKRSWLIRWHQRLFQPSSSQVLYLNRCNNLRLLLSKRSVLMCPALQRWRRSTSERMEVELVRSSLKTWIVGEKNHVTNGTLTQLSGPGWCLNSSRPLRLMDLALKVPTIAPTETPNRRPFSFSTHTRQVGSRLLTSSSTSS